MTGTQQDDSIGFKKESVYGTAVTVDTFPEFLAEDLNWIPTYASGEGMRVGKTVQRASRRVLVKEEVGGSFTVEATSKGLGKLFEAALGVATSTLVAGSTYQQVFTVATTDYLPSYTIQKGITQVGGSASPQTYAGMVCSGFEFDGSNAAIPKIKFNFVGKSMETTTGLATPSYASSVELFSFPQATLTVGGTVTVPTTSALASGGTATSDIRDFQFTWENSFDSNGFNFGSAGKRSRKGALGGRVGSGTFTAEYDSDVIRDAWKNNTSLSLVLTFTMTATPISGSLYPTLQICIPTIVLEGEMPKANGGDVVALSVPFAVLDNGVAASPVYVAILTAETAV